MKQSSAKTFWALIFCYGLVSAFFVANFYSLGLYFSFWPLLTSLLLLAPLYGVCSIGLDAFSLYVLLKCFGPPPTFSQLAHIVAYSKRPYFFSLAAWVGFIFLTPQTAFLHFGSPGSALFLLLTQTAAYLWALFLIIRSIHKFQPLAKALAAVFGSLFLSGLIVLITMFLIRYAFVYLIN